MGQDQTLHARSGGELTGAPPRQVDPAERVARLLERGLGEQQVRSLSGRAFAGTPARQEQYLEEMGTVYADAMARTGLAKTS